jgi:hypothetical protein
MCIPFCISLIILILISILLLLLLPLLLLLLSSSVFIVRALRIRRRRCPRLLELLRETRLQARLRFR